MKKSKNANSDQTAPKALSKKIIAIIGTTATGKSDLAVYLAKQFNGEIISADSRQVYKGMDIGTGKISIKEMRGIKHHMLNVASPRNASFNVLKFKNASSKIIADIFKRGKIPIIAGGTGFWIDALLFDQNFPDVKPNSELRRKLENFTEEKLFKILESMDAEWAQKIDKKNKRRLIRAIEIAKSGLKFKDIQNQNAPKWQTLFIGLELPKELLEQKIYQRMQKRFAQGMTKEVQNLHKHGVSWKTLENFGLEYKFISQYLRQKIKSDPNENAELKMRQLLFTAIKNYAKRQKTWFKKNKNIIWLDAGNKKTCYAQAKNLTQKFLKS